MKKMIVVFSVILILFLARDTIFDFQYNSTTIGPGRTAERAEIQQVLSAGNEENLMVKLLTGDLKGSSFTIVNNYYHSDYYTRPFKVKDTFIVAVDRSQNLDEPEITILNYARDRISFSLVIIFLALMILVGKKQGLKSAISLIITILIIIKVMLPLILEGFHPILSATVCCLVISIVNLLIITGGSLKTTATLIGTSFGVLVAGVLAYVVGFLSHFSGLNDEDSLLLTTVQQGTIDLNGILFAGIIIGTLGAVMDVSMSISSSMNEIIDNNPAIDRMKLVRSGLNIGKDVMGTMADTLILAYAGTAIPLLLFSLSKETPLIILLNSEAISTEILRALSGSIGIILSIPATSFAFAMLLQKGNKKGTALQAVNLRETPAIGENIIGKIEQEERLTILAHKKGWYKIQRSNGEVGWIRENGLTPSVDRVILNKDC
jgi:uncharacterized membrane protein